ncbi:neck protein [Morganella phage vB_Mm5]
MITNTPTQLKDEILRRLGAPIVKVEVTTEQIYDCIQRSLELFGEYHYDGLNKSYILIKATEEQARTGLYNLNNPSLFAVTQIIRANAGSLMTMDGTTVYPWFTDFVMGMTGNSVGNCQAGVYGGAMFGGNLSYFTQLSTYQTQMQDAFNPLPEYYFNSTTGQLMIRGNINAGDFVVLEVYIKSYVDTDYAIGSVAGYARAGGESDASYADVYENPRSSVEYRAGGANYSNDGNAYNNRWVRDYATALVKEINGIVLAKMNGLALVGNISADGNRMIQESREDQARLREELLLLTDTMPIIIR